MTNEQKQLIEASNALTMISEMLEDHVANSPAVCRAGMRQKANDAIDYVWDLRTDLLKQNGMDDGLC